MDRLQQLLWELIIKDCVEGRGEDKEEAGVEGYYDTLEKVLKLIIGEGLKVEKNVAVKEGRRNRVDFAIRGNESDRYKIIIEFKRPAMLTQSICYDSKSSKLILKKRGELENYERWKSGKKGYPAKEGDWVGQLRGYFLSMKEEGKLDDDSFSILTNGLLWVIFKFDSAKEVNDSVADSEIVSYFVLPNDYERLKEKIKELLG
jgi:hypothetical protein